MDVDRDDLRRWVERYEQAWRAPGTADLHELFAGSAVYSPGPFAEPLCGITAIAAFWEAERDGPDEVFRLSSEPVAVDGDVGVARVEVTYGDPPDRIYRDLWLVELDDRGRCVSFEEWPFHPGQPLVASSQPSVPSTLDGAPAEACGVRLRQAVLAAGELEPVAGALQAELGLGPPFRDPEVGLFGLHNVVFALEDCFLEVVSPLGENTAAGRHLARNGGDGGYMVIFDLVDLEGARARARELGVREAWQIDLPDISTAHLHPSDMHGAIVSLDQSRPYGTWRWGGPDWRGQVGTGAPVRLVGVTIAVADPRAVAQRWAHVLGVKAEESGGRQLIRLDGGQVAFEAAAADAPQGLAEIVLELTPAARRGRTAVELCGVRLTLC